MFFSRATLLFVTKNFQRLNPAEQEEVRWKNGLVKRK